MFAPGSKNRLTRHDLPRFPGDTLFDRVARVVCEVGRLPRKELYETFAVARHVHRRMCGGRLVELCAGHDAVIERALAARARVAVLPCCHVVEPGAQGGLGGWLEPTLAIDVMRAARLRAAGYTVTTRSLDPAITPKNRLLLGTPDGQPGRPQVDAVAQPCDS